MTKESETRPLLPLLCGRLTQGEQAQKVVGAPTELGRRLTNALAYTGSTEKTVLLDEPETLDPALRQDEEVEAKAEAEKVRPGLTMFTDGSGRCRRLCGGLEEGGLLGGHQNAHGIQPGGV